MGKVNQSSLKSRLSRIRGSERNTAIDAKKPSAVDEKHNPRIDGDAAPSWPGWTDAGYMTLKRVVSLDLAAALPAAFPTALAAVIPDLAAIGRVPQPEDLLFFDLETSGLSGGAGTLAFLAAFGRIRSPEKTGCKNRGTRRDNADRINVPARLEITQYLLLDYPGECDFVERVVGEFPSTNTEIRQASLVPCPLSPVPVLVTYNGKTFDSQILKTRCLMNGIKAPEYFHADLLHPARRLWKNILPDCSQATIEVSVLGLNRTGDVSGALAPDIWFSFLRSGDNRELLSICEHNIKDIAGLASLFFAMGEIAARPLDSREKFGFDMEGLALSWDRAVRKRPSFFGAEEKETGALLLETAARIGHKRAAFTMAQDYFKNGKAPEARSLMKQIADDDLPECPGGEIIPGSPGLRAAALKALAIDAEWRQKDIPLALAYTGAAMGIHGIPGGLRNELEKRRARLIEKN